jgi:hypothetical protein
MRLRLAAQPQLAALLLQSRDTLACSCSGALLGNLNFSGKTVGTRNFEEIPLSFWLSRDRPLLPVDASEFSIGIV